MTTRANNRRREPIWMLFVGLIFLVWTLVGICLPQPRPGAPVAILTAAGDPDMVLDRLLEADAIGSLLTTYADGRVIVVYPSQLKKMRTALRGTPSMAIDAAFVGCAP